MIFKKIIEKIKLIFVFIFIVFSLGSCAFFNKLLKINKENSVDFKFKNYLVGGIVNSSFTGHNPYAMVLIPGGSFTIGNVDQDLPLSLITPPKTITISAFYMDETEITNHHYSMFIGWVKDSISHKIIGGDHIIEDPTGETEGTINWTKTIDYSNNPNSETYSVLEEFMIPIDERLNVGRIFDSRKVKYKYIRTDYTKAVNAGRKAYNSMYRGDVFEIKEVDVYPDTLVWMRDFVYSFNEPMMRTYFNNPSFFDYPIVGVTWDQARAFNDWRTKMYKNYLIEASGGNIAESGKINDFRLPSEFEWEYAATGGLQRPVYPWGGPYIRNNKGCFLANFKPMRGKYDIDGFIYTNKVSSFNPNQFGLYDMAGNVAEWTKSQFDENGYAFVDDINPNLEYEASKNDPPAMKRKVVKGGSWRDIGYFLQVSAKTYQFQDSATSAIGFRSAMSALSTGAGFLSYY